MFMNCVLAGTAYLAVVGVFNGAPIRGERRTSLADILRDWMPFMLSATITAGVAPLLFLQVLYKSSFYSAHLLLFHRWMLILPVLILGFYALYVLKSGRVGRWLPPVRMAVGLVPVVCMVFTAYAWSENHLLSLCEDVWPGLYGEEQTDFRARQIIPRLGIWFFGAFPAMGVWAAWMLRGLVDMEEESRNREIRRCAVLSVGGMALAMGCALWYYLWMESEKREAVTSAMASPYLVMAILGLAVQSGAWLTLWRNPSSPRGHLWAATVGAVATLLGSTVVRESLRVSAIDVSGLRDAHAHAASVGGLSVFLVCALINTALIVWCVTIVRRGAGNRP